MKSILTTICLSITMTTMAQNKTIEVWPGNVPGEEKPKSEAVVSADSSGNVTRFCEVTNPILQEFKPSVKSNNKSIIICPGGAYNILAYDLEGTEIAAWLNSIGYTAYVLQYRVPKKRDGALQDLQRAIRIIKNKNYEKVGVIGFSAGASLSARAATRSDKPSYQAIDKLDSLSCRPDFAMLIYPAYMDLGENRTLTPELTISNLTPPIFVFQTAVDPYGNSAFTIAQALRDHKVPVELHVLPIGAHGYGLRKGTRAGETWPKLAEIWLDTLE